MLAAIVHLSDLHLGEQRNSLELKLGPLAAAICSTDSRCRHYLIVLSGDIAYHGTNEEYMVATRLIKNLEEAITSRLQGAQTTVLAVPGNHDCVLPEKAASLRSALINAIEPSLQTGAPDAAILESLLDAQTNYYAFCQSLGSPQMAPDDKLCTTTTVQVEEKRIQFALYNTALLSKRHEEQGQLSVPVELIRSRITVDTNSDLTVSVYHHPQPWLQADVGIAFRNHIENTCEIALTGHQHADHGFIKQTLAGQRLLYSEGDVLQDPDSADQSGFRVIVTGLG